MHAPSSPKAASKKTHKWLLIAVAIAFISFLVVKHYLDLPQNLGPDVVYIGKQDYGTIPFISDSYPGSTLYFGTDMGVSDLGLYFADAGYRLSTSTDWFNDGVVLELESKREKEEGISLYYYRTIEAARGTTSATLESKKKNFIRIDSKDYQKLRQALRDADLLR